MAVTLEVRICDLLTELLANALILFSALKAAGAISAGTLQTILYGLNHFCIFVKSDSHRKTPFFFLLYTGCQEQFFPLFFL